MKPPYVVSRWEVLDPSSLRPVGAPQELGCESGQLRQHLETGERLLVDGCALSEGGGWCGESLLTGEVQGAARPSSGADMGPS